MSVFAIVFIAGCGTNFAPTSTSRAVVPNDIVGTWHYRPVGSSEEVTLVLRPDSKFDQVVRTSAGQSHTSTGEWRIKGSAINLDDVLIDFVGWEPHSASWRIIDRDESPAGFAIFGGAADPDQWVIMHWTKTDE